MHDPVKYLVNQGFDTTFVSHAITKLKGHTRTWKSTDKFIDEICNVLDETLDNLTTHELSFFEARYLYFYIVQNLLTANKHGQVLENTDLLCKSLLQARKFCTDHHISLQEEARELGIATEDNNDQHKHQRRGTKTERALNIFIEEINGKDVNDRDARTSIMQRFRDELDMEKGGALTYYHATKKRYIKNLVD